MDWTPIILAIVTGLVTLGGALIGIWRLKIEMHKDAVAGKEELVKVKCITEESNAKLNDAIKLLTLAARTGDTTIEELRRLAQRVENIEHGRPSDHMPL